MLSTVQRPLSTALLVLAVTATARAQETPSDTLLTVQHYLDWEQVADPRIAPDGQSIIYTRRWVDRVADRWESAIWIMDADGSRQRFLTRGSSARWSPDGTRILYLAEGEPKGTQVFVRWMDAEGATSQVTRLATTPASVRWSPDGRWISFATLVAVSDTVFSSLSMPAAPAGATWTAPPRVVDRLHYRQDQRGYMERGYTHLFVVPAEGGTPRQLTRGSWHAGQRGFGLDDGVGHDWLPDGRTIVFDGLRDNDSDHRFRESHLYSVDVVTGAIRQLTAERGFWSGPVVSPDGRQIAYTGSP